MQIQVFNKINLYIIANVKVFKKNQLSIKETKLFFADSTFPALNFLY